MMRLYSSKLLLLGTAAVLLGGCGGSSSGGGGANEAPVAVNDATTTSEDTFVNIMVTSNDTDPDGNDTINKDSVVIVTQPANGSVAPENDGTGTVVYTPGTGYSGSDSFTYTVADTEGEISNTATVTITVTAVNSGVPAATDDTASTVEATPVNIDVTSNDTDPDGNDTIDKSTVAIVAQPSSGTAVANTTNGTVDYTPVAGFSGPVTFTYTVKDDFGATSNAATVTVTVGAVASGSNWGTAKWGQGKWAP